MLVSELGTLAFGADTSTKCGCMYLLILEVQKGGFNIKMVP